MKIIIEILGWIAAIIIAFGFSWIITVGTIKLITMCFGWTFRWSIATGIWLIWLMVREIFGGSLGKD